MSVINKPTASQHKIKKLPVSNFFFDTSNKPILSNISANFRKAPMGYSGAGGNWFMKKSPKVKISCQTPFKILPRVEVSANKIQNILAE
jgi:hypothetical protein